MKPLVLLLLSLPCAAKPVDAQRLSTLLGFHGQSVPLAVEEPATPLPFRLLGTLRGATSLVSLAASTRVITATVGDVVFGAEIVSIERTEIVVRRGNRVERLTFETLRGAPPPALPSTPKLTRALLQQQLSDPSALMTQVRMVPAFSGGKMTGFKAVSVQRDSLAERLGLRRGDIITGVNGQSLDNAQRLLELYQQLSTSRHFVVELEREGQRVTQALSLDE